MSIPSNLKTAFCCALAYTVLVAPCCAEDIPALFSTPTTTRTEWEAARRPYLLAQFERTMFGQTPRIDASNVRFERLEMSQDLFKGTACKQKIRIHYTVSGSTPTSFDVLAVYPKTAKPVPVFLEMSINYPGAYDETLTTPCSYWPAEQIVKRGYAALIFNYTNAAPDDAKAFFDWKAKTWKQAETPNTAPFSAISIWAWSISRVIDWIATEPAFDAQRIAVVGFSRGGKTALWAGAQDPRIALTLSCCSGSGGAKLIHQALPQSETIEHLVTRFPHWFTPNYAAYAHREKEAPFDMHQMLALVAPRLLYISSATEDRWAGPEGEFASCQRAAPAWSLYTKTGFTAQTFPAANTPLHDASIGYHLRKGPHLLTEYDWHCYLDFADRHLK